MFFEMPSEALSLAVTTGLGVSVLAGVVSGICYIISQGLGRRRNRSAQRPWHCSVCDGQFRSIQGILEVEKVATCAKCKQKVCRIRCSRRDPLKGWICQICQQPEAWFKAILNAIHPSKGAIFSNMDQEAMDELDEDLTELRKKEREQVRDFIERLVESLLGGTLDDVNVGRLYNDRKYDALFERYHSDLSNALTDLGSALHISISNLPITGQSPCSAHATLKHLIQRFNSEASELPELKGIQDHPALPEAETADRTYEDLLSTAIINKVVQSGQEVARSNSNSVSSRASRRTFLSSSNNREYFFSGETLDEKWRGADGRNADDTSSASSLDEWVRSDSSVGSAKYVDRISLTIKQCIDDGADLTSEADSLHEQETLEAEDAWSENWYLQKRLASSNSPVPVPMLVPNPIEDAKVYIGDKEADELSDIESDYGEAELVPDIKHILVNSRTIIGGKNALENVENLTDAVVTAEDVNRTEEAHLEIPHLIGEETQDASLLSIDSHTEKDTEYTEQYASLPRTIVKEPKPAPRTYKARKSTGINTEQLEEPISTSQNGWNSQEQLNGDVESEEINAFEGSYSRKEKEKWKHAVDLPHNPYSAENLERRLSNRSSDGSTTSSLFGRDYYIRQASRSAGASKKDLAEPTVDETSADSEGETLVTALPALVNPDDEESGNDFLSMGESSAAVPPSRPSQLEVSSDSDMSIERIYNPQTGTMIQNVRGVTQEFAVNNSKSPQGIKYVEKEFDCETTRPIDENHNRTTVELQKRDFLRSLTMESDEIDPPVVNEDVPYTPSAPAFHENITRFESMSNGIEKKLDNPREITSSLQKTLSKFDDITNEFSVDTKENIQNTEVYEHIENNQVEVALDPNVVQDFDCILKAKDLTTYQIPAKYFGDVKRSVDNKITTKTSDYSEEECSENKEFSLEYSTDITDDVSRPESSLETDPEILDLKEKKLVKDLLGRYSKSFPNVSSIPPPKRTEEIEIKKQISMENVIEEFVSNGINHNDQVVTTNGYEENAELDHIPSVQNLKKLFDRETAFEDPKKDTVQVYSLTARSLPKSIRQKLKSDEDLSVKPVEEMESATEEYQEELPADITKNRIKFFEELQRKKR